MYTEALITQHCRSYLKIMKNNKSDCLGCDATSKERFYITLLQVLSSTIVAQLIILTCIFVNAFLLLILHTLNKKFLPPSKAFDPAFCTSELQFVKKKSKHRLGLRKILWIGNATVETSKRLVLYNIHQQWQKNKKNPL